MAVPTDTGDRSGEVAVFFLSHTLHRSVRARFADLVAESRPGDDVFFAYDATDAADGDRRLARDVAGDRLRPYEAPEVLDTDYPAPWADPERKSLVPGNLDLLYLHLARTAPGYERYWFVEYDVAYTGSWAEVLRAPAPSADLIGTTLHAFDRNPDWYWWPYFDPAPDLDRSAWLRGFFPILGVSPDALDRIDRALRAGWSGHAESLLPTVARHEGLELEDLGGEGPYVRAENRNRFYTNTPEGDDLAPGTFIYRPARPRPGRSSGRLWHPVKPDQGHVSSYVGLLKRWLRARVRPGD